MKKVSGIVLFFCSVPYNAAEKIRCRKATHFKDSENMMQKAFSLPEDVSRIPRGQKKD